MKAYYDEGGITIIHADCRDVLPTLAAGSAHLVLTDPPYAEETHSGARTGRRVAGDTRAKTPIKLVDFDSFTVAEQRECFELIAPVAATWVVSFMDWHHIVDFDRKPPTGLRFVRFGIWVKPDGAPQFTGDRPGQGWEGIAFMHRLGGKMAWNGGGHHGVFTCPNLEARSGQVEHTTQKPLRLVKQLVSLFSQPGDLVLDCFGGSGTTARACKDLGRRCLMIERDERNCDIAANRLQQTAMHLETV